MEELHRDLLEIIVYYFMGHDSCSSKVRSLVLMPFFLFSFPPPFKWLYIIIGFDG